MGNFKRKPSFGGTKTSGRHAKHGAYRAGSGAAGRSGSRSSGGDFRRTELHQATCSQCGQSCEVPFKPNGKKPVFCRDCFKKSDAPSYSKPAYGKPPYGKPSYNKSAYGKSSYGRPSPYKTSAPKKEADYSAALEEINAKLNKILRALEQE